MVQIVQSGPIENRELEKLQLHPTIRRQVFEARDTKEATICPGYCKPRFFLFASKKKTFIMANAKTLLTELSKNKICITNCLQRKAL